MIIGRFAVPPSLVLYGSKRFDPDTKCTEIAIYMDDGTILSQYMDNTKDIDKAMKAIDQCVTIADEADREARREDADGD